jgi:hypothetical protein
MIKNENGDVAMTYFQSSGKYLRMGDGMEYVFVTRRNICFSWVNPKHVDQILNKSRKCCGGSKKRVFRLSSQQEVNLWTGVGGVR